MTAAAVVFGAATCNILEPAEACSIPSAESSAGIMLMGTRENAEFGLRYPCYLPNSQHLTSSTVIGTPGRQQVEMVWEGPFYIALRQSQYPPAASPDPTGASRTIIDLFSNVRATLIERYDGSGQALYHLFWQRNRVYYEIQAFGPPQQRRIILDIARSLEPIESLEQAAQ